ncbi:MAG: GNAT family N-acetyltransferase [Candidatus Thorarchaeota archaeon]
MAIRVEDARSLEDYERAWTECMQSVYWFNDRHFFDYHPDDERADIHSAFGIGNNIFLTAKTDESSDIVGVLGCEIRGRIGLIRRWEPAVQPHVKRTAIAEGLLNECIRQLENNAITRIQTKLRYLVDSPSVSSWLLEVYYRLGFRDCVPPSVSLLFDIKTLTLNERNDSPSISLVNADDYSVEDLAELTVRSFASTDTDRAMHGWDESVSNYESSVRTIQHVKKGGFGVSTPECRRVALVDDEPAGLILSFIPEAVYRPPYGVVGQLGVAPNFRQRGIASLLIQDIFRVFKKHGCQYAYVGTPAANQHAIHMYETNGFEVLFKILDLEKSFDEQSYSHASDL